MTAVVDMSRELLHTCKNDPDLRLKKSAFTRERKLGAERMLHMLLHRLSGPLQLELDAYCEFLETAPVSKQAFSKARANLNPAFVRKFVDGLAELHAKDSDAPTWCGMRLIAIDGTDIALENSAELKRVLAAPTQSGTQRQLWVLWPMGRWTTRSMTAKLRLTPPMSVIWPSCICSGFSSWG